MAALFLYMCTRAARSVIYVDGFNLYYGVLKNTAYKWLDLQRFFTPLELLRLAQLPLLLQDGSGVSIQKPKEW